MQPLLFFSRVAFICNICFLLTLSYYFFEPDLSSYLAFTIWLLGLWVGIALNLIINLIIIVLLLLRKPLLLHVPKWLIIANAIVLVPQLIYFFT